LALPTLAGEVQDTGLSGPDAIPRPTPSG